MSLRKLPSGSWNYRQMVDGHNYSFTYDHKPTKREMDEDLFEAKKKNNHVILKGTFNEHAERYLKDKNNVLSSTTIVNYNSILKNLSDEFKNLNMNKITSVEIQREINSYTVGRSPKSVKNASGFITVVMRYYNPEIFINTKLPQKVKVKVYIPTDDEAKKILKYFKDDEYEAAILLALMGLRRSEILAVTADDIKGNILTIDKAKVKAIEKGYHIKTTKTESSTREIYIPSRLAKLIKKQGYAYKGTPGGILKALHRAQDALGIHRSTLHALRHYYVSYAHSQGIPDIYIAKAVGHSNVATTQRIYTHAQEDRIEEMQIKAAPFK